MKRCVGVGKNFPDKQQSALGTKCAMESVSNPDSSNRLGTAEIWETIRVYFKFIYSFTTSLNDPPIQRSRPKMEKNPQG